MRWPMCSVRIFIVPVQSWNLTYLHFLLDYLLGPKEKPATLRQAYLSNSFLPFFFFFFFYDADTDGDASVSLRCKGSLFTYDLACSNWRNGALQSFILLEWCAFILDVTAEYEYENMKRAVESDWVLIFMRIIHNVFTGLAATCTSYYVNGL